MRLIMNLDVAVEGSIWRDHRSLFFLLLFALSRRSTDWRFAGSAQVSFSFSFFFSFSSVLLCSLVALSVCANQGRGEIDRFN
jgi:hypothetical protein